LQDQFDWPEDQNWSEGINLAADDDDDILSLIGAVMN
jgi:hypothetical protein